ncbi:hypothetical protein KSS87_022273 [Heliosperma pusillum]|nr:hypothetical protein KSS87_022273 [Heliosperma pusillum]
MKPTILTMWDELTSNEGSYISQFLDSFPIILATRLGVTSYNGISLSTKSSTTVLLNPQTPESQALQDWILQNEEQIKLLKKDKAVPAPTMNARAPPAVIPINSVSETTKHMPETNLCRAQRNILLSQMWSGPRCSTKVHSYSNLYTSVRYAAFHYHDLYCRSILHTDRCNFQIELADGATSLTDAIFGENAEKVFKINAKTLMELSEDPHQFFGIHGYRHNLGNPSLDLKSRKKNKKEEELSVEGGKMQHKERSRTEERGTVDGGEIERGTIDGTDLEINKKKRRVRSTAEKERGAGGGGVVMKVGWRGTVVVRRCGCRGVGVSGWLGGGSLVVLCEERRMRDLFGF